MKQILFLGSVLLGILLIVPGVLAADTTGTGTAIVSGNPDATLTFVVTGEWSLGNMSVGSTDNTGNTVSTDITSNTPWAISVHDGLTDSKPEGNDGKMAAWNATASAYVASGNVLTNAMKVSPGGEGYADLTGAASPVTLFTGSTAGSFTNAPHFEQTVVIADQRLDTPNFYRMVVTLDAGQT